MGGWMYTGRWIRCEEGYRKRSAAKQLETGRDCKTQKNRQRKKTASIAVFFKEKVFFTMGVAKNYIMYWGYLQVL